MKLPRWLGWGCVSDEEFANSLDYPFLYCTDSVPGYVDPLCSREFVCLANNWLKKKGGVDFSKIEHDTDLQSKIKHALRAKDYKKAETLIMEG